MTIDEMKKQMIKDGQDPNDYCIFQSEFGFSVFKKEFSPSHAKYTDQENQPVKEDLEVVAETSVNASMDLQEIANTLVYALEEIEKLKGGNL